MKQYEITKEQLVAKKDTYLYHYSTFNIALFIFVSTSCFASCFTFFRKSRNYKIRFDH